MVDAQALALAHDRFPARGLMIQIDAVDRVEEVKRPPQLLLDAIHQRPYAFRAELLLQVGDRWSRVKAQLVVHEEVVSHPVLHRHGVARPERPFETVRPAEERQAERPAARPANLLVKIAFLPAEPAQPGIEAGPRGPAAGEHP
jgi:hypothetical protein